MHSIALILATKTWEKKHQPQSSIVFEFFQMNSSRCQPFFVEISIGIIYANESNMFQWMAEQEEEEKYTEK